MQRAPEKIDVAIDIGTLHSLSIQNPAYSAAQSSKSIASLFWRLSRAKGNASQTMHHLVQFWCREGEAPVGNGHLQEDLLRGSILCLSLLEALRELSEALDQQRQQQVILLAKYS